MNADTLFLCCVVAAACVLFGCATPPVTWPDPDAYIQPRPPADGVPPYTWIPHWSAPAVLCIPTLQIAYNVSRDHWECVLP